LKLLAFRRKPHVLGYVRCAARVPLLIRSSQKQNVLLRIHAIQSLYRSCHRRCNNPQSAG
jgi:hypothetical protein